MTGQANGAWQPTPGVRRSSFRSLLARRGCTVRLGRNRTRDFGVTDFTMKNAVALTLAASTLFLAGCCTSHRTAVWQYETVGSLDKVNKMAADGWVVVGFTTYVEPASSNQGPVTRDSYLLKRLKR
jgi:hypothetical protein